MRTHITHELTIIYTHTHTYDFKYSGGYHTMYVHTGAHATHILHSGTHIHKCNTHIHIQTTQKNKTNTEAQKCLRQMPIYTSHMNTCT